MGLIWGTQLFIAIFFLTILILFFALMFLPKCTPLAKHLTHLILRYKYYVMAPSLLLIALIPTELSKIASAAKKKRYAIGDVFFFESSNMFRAQRNFYIILLGLVAEFGILTIAMEISYWEKRILQLNRKLIQ